MRALGLGAGGAIRHVVALAAHPDDIEIGCGGTLLRLAEACPDLTADVVVATGDPARIAEAHHAVSLFLPGCAVKLHAGGLADGRLPAQWSALKDLLEATAASRSPDLVLGPRRTDLHQDHRTLAEQIRTVWRDHLVLGYEIPKWDGDLGRPSLYVPMSADVAQDKVRLLSKAYPSQVGRDWWDEETFLGLARLRGMECRSRYAEAFTVPKAALRW
jgi:LmbE family N-acetylglucosaminyl deacetylase